MRNDITEAREYPQQTLGIDLMSFGHWPHDRMASSLRGQPLITGVLEVHHRTDGDHALPRCLPRRRGLRGATASRRLTLTGGAAHAGGASPIAPAAGTNEPSGPGA